MLRIGILGAGGMGAVHARQYKKMEAVDLTFFDKSIERTDSFVQRFDIPPAESADDIIQSCDVVDICLPTDLHLEYGLKAIAAGKAVFMEKPMVRSLEEGETLLNAAAQAGVPLMPGQVVRFFPEFSSAKKSIERGSIGTPAAARTRRGGLPPMGGMDNWFMDHERSGGVLLDLAVHDFDWLRWTLGEVDHLYSRSVGAQLGTGPDYALTTLTFDSGAVGHVEATWMDPAGFRVTFEVAGSDGLIQYDSRQTPTLRAALAPAVAAGGTEVPGATPAAKAGPTIQVESPQSPLNDPYYLQLSAFLKAVRTGTPPPVSGQDGLAAVSIALAALESARTGQVVRPARMF